MSVYQTAWIAGTAAALGTPSNGGRLWHNLGAAGLPDGAEAYCTSGVNSPPNNRWRQLVVHVDLTKAIPAEATAWYGIEARVTRRKASGSANIVDTDVYLAQGTAAVGANRSAGATWASTTEQALFGGRQDLWGSSLTIADLRSAGFGLYLGGTYSDTAADTDFRVDGVELRVTYEAPFEPVAGELARQRWRRRIEGVSRAPLHWLVEARAWWPARAAFTTLYYGSDLVAPLATGPDDVPASVEYLPRVGAITWDSIHLWQPGQIGGAIGDGAGTIDLVNQDGGLDWLADLVFADSAVSVWLGRAGWPRSRYRLEWTGLIEQAAIDRAVRLVIYDARRRLDRPIQPLSYEASHLSAGAAKPLTIGHVRNVTPVPTDANDEEFDYSSDGGSVIQAYVDGGAVSGSGITGHLTLSAAAEGDVTVDVNGLSGGISIEIPLTNGTYWTPTNITPTLEAGTGPWGIDVSVLKATAANGTMVGPPITSGVPSIVGFGHRRRKGSGAVEISGDGTTWYPLPVGDDWRVDFVRVPSADAARLRIATSGDEIETVAAIATNREYLPEIRGQIGSYALDTDRTSVGDYPAAEILYLLSIRCGLVPWLEADQLSFADINDRAEYDSGLYEDANRSTREAIAALLASIMGYLDVTPEGWIRIGMLDPPAADPDLVLDATDGIEARRLRSAPPPWQMIFEYQRNWTIQRRLPASVPVATRFALAVPYRRIVFEDEANRDLYGLRSGVLKITTTIDALKDAEIEGARQWELFRRPRHFVEVDLPGASLPVPRGATVALTWPGITYPVDGRPAAKRYRFIGWRASTRDERSTMTLWGGDDDPRL